MVLAVGACPNSKDHCVVQVICHPRAARPEQTINRRAQFKLWSFIVEKDKNHLDRLAKVVRTEKV